MVFRKTNDIVENPEFLWKTGFSFCHGSHQSQQGVANEC